MSRGNTSISAVIDRWIAGKISREIGSAPVCLELWDNQRYIPAGVEPVGTVRFEKRSALLKLLIEPELYFGDGYSAGDIKTEGELSKLLESVYRATKKLRPGSFLAGILSRCLEWLQSNSVSGSRRNIHSHYDIGNEFYRLWLDRQLVYTCAYFRRDGDSLEEAQVAKMDHVCRKLGLEPGDRVVEAGCGWGALALHMARHYGARVRAFNISRDQIEYARRRAEQEGLSSLVEFVEDDYRNISGRYDAFVSVGMLEHVGESRYKDLGRIIDRSLHSRGRGFIHFIGRNRKGALSLWTRKRIFPGASPPTLRQAMKVFEEHDMSILDVENLRLHYARTLEHWLARFEAAKAGVAEMFGPEFVRAWRLYLTGSIAAFRSGTLQLFQISFARGTDNSIPWTRAHIYASEDA